jgi:hypothetical protein
MNDDQVASAYLDSLSEELDAAGLSPVALRPQGFGFTLKEYIDKHNCSDTSARKVMERAVKAGLLTVHRMSDGVSGACPYVYCRPSEWPPRG